MFKDVGGFMKAIGWWWFVVLGTSFLGLLWSVNQQPTLDALLSPRFWGWPIIALVVACFFAWREEHEQVAALAIKRPEFSCVLAGFEQSQTTDGRKIDLFLLRFGFENKSGLRATRLHRRVVVITDFALPPLGDNSETTGNDVFEILAIRSEVTIPRPIPRHYFAVYLSYLDARNGHRYDQQFFFQCPPSRANNFDMNFRSATLEERNRIESYVASIDQAKP